MLKCSAGMMYCYDGALEILEYLCICLCLWSRRKFGRFNKTACSSDLAEALNRYLLVCLGQQPVRAY